MSVTRAGEHGLSLKHAVREDAVIATAPMSPLYAVDQLDPDCLYTVDVDGISTRYYDSRTSGPPLVLFHGGQFGSLYSLDSFSLNLIPLAERFRVIAVDKMGQGYTGGPPDGSSYTYEAVVHHACRFMEILDLRDAHLAGHSRGGMLIASMAYELPERVASLVIVNSGTLAPDDPSVPNFYGSLPHVPGPPSLESVRIEPDAQAFKPEMVTEDFLHRLLAIAREPAFQAIQADMAAFGAAQFLESLDAAHEAILARIDAEGLPTRTLLLWSADDKSVPTHRRYWLWDRVRATTPDTELHIFNQGGHYTFRENPEAFHRAIISFCLGG